MTNTHYRAKSGSKWVYGYYYNNCDVGTNKSFIVSENWEQGTADYWVINQPNIGLSICTMMKDKNDNYIYEGDFLISDIDDRKIYYPVVYNVNTGTWCLDVSYWKNLKHLVPIIDYLGSGVEIDGNIFDNPERLPKLNYNDNNLW